MRWYDGDANQSKLHPQEEVVAPLAAPVSSAITTPRRRGWPLSDIVRCVPVRSAPATFGSGDGTGVRLPSLQTEEHEFNVFRISTCWWKRSPP
jgi:hypothetical protein